MIRNGAMLLIAIALCACSDSNNNDAAVSAGELMYRGGILSSGEPMTALVGGDIPIIGTQFSCESCHGRSGMGASEGAYVVPPIGAQFLFNESPQPKRPAYDRASLARVLREGITPSGRALSPELMPRYEIDDADVDVLISFLATLSAGNSPGVDETTIRFATIVTEGVSDEERNGVVGVVHRFAEDINRQTRNDSGRWDRGYTPESKLPTVFRQWVVDEWVLTGPPATWTGQLERYYEEAPVFAVIGGLAEGSWEPVNAFCETNKVPCLYPSTDLPYRDDDDFYAVYFSRGLLLEADLIATHLAGEPAQAVVQVYCDPNLAPVVKSLEESLRTAGNQVTAVDFECGDSVPTLDGDALTVLWLDRTQLDTLPRPIPSDRLFVSSTLLDRDIENITATGEVHAAHPYRLPGKVDPAFRRFELWAKTRGIEIVSPRRQAETFFACLVLNDAVKHMGRFYIREFALDMMDHGESMSAFVPVYPRPSFGPGQRYINKGGYVLPIVNGEVVTSEAAWILP